MRIQIISALLGSVLLCSTAFALEPVDPQPATPLTFENPAYQKVVPSVAQEMIKEGVVVIDVRNPIERITEGYIKGSVNVPLPTLKPGAKLTAAPDFNQKVFDVFPKNAAHPFERCHSIRWKLQNETLFLTFQNCQIQNF